MSDKNLRLQVVLSALDRITGPLKRITGESGATAQALRTTRERLKELQAQQAAVGQFRQLHGELRTTSGRLQEAQQHVNQLAARMKATEAPTRTMTREFNAAVRASEALRQRAQQQGQQLQDLRTRLSAAGISTASLGTHERRLRSDLASTNAALAQQEARLKATADRMRRLAEAKSRYDKTMAVRGQLTGAGIGMTAAGTGALYGGARLLAPGVEFDSTMSRVQALARLDKDDPRLAALREQARQLGAETMFSATDAARGQAFLAMAGFTPESIRAAMPGLLDMAKAGDLDLGLTADIASNILGGFRLDADQMSQVADVLTKAFTTSNVSLEMLGDTMKYVGPVASTAGMGLEEAAAMAGLLGNVGIQSTQAGTTLRAMLLRLAAPVGPATKAMQELGIRAKDSEGNVRSITEVLSEVAIATEKLGSAERLSYLKAIFGEEPAAGMAELINQAGAGGITKYLDIIRDHQGAAAQTAKVMGDNITGDLDELSSAWDDVRIELFDGQNSGLRELIRNITGVVGSIGAWMKENPQLTATLLKIAAVVAVLVATMGALTLSAAAVLGPIAIVRYSLAFLGMQGGLLSVILRGLGTAFLWVGRGILFAGRMMLANPIGILITLLATLAYLVYRNWEPIAQFFADRWAAIRQVFSGGLASIGAAILNWSPVGLFYSAFATVLNWFGLELPTRFSEAGTAILRGLIGGITGGLSEAKNAIMGAGEAVIDWFKQRLGIRSPSRVFAELGGFITQGLSQGIEGGQRQPLDRINGLTSRIAQAGAGLAIAAAAAPAAAIGGPGNAPLAFDTRPPIQRTATAPMVVEGDRIEIHFHVAGGTDPHAIAQIVASELDRRERDKAARLRSRFQDYD